MNEKRKEHLLEIVKSLMISMEESIDEGFLKFLAIHRPSKREIVGCLLAYTITRTVDLYPHTEEFLKEEYKKIMKEVLKNEP